MRDLALTVRGIGFAQRAGPLFSLLFPLAMQPLSNHLANPSAQYDSPLHKVSRRAPSARAGDGSSPAAAAPGAAARARAGEPRRGCAAGPRRTVPGERRAYLSFFLGRSWLLWPHLRAVLSGARADGQIRL
jgi:hypothetical protein